MAFENLKRAFDFRSDDEIRQAVDDKETSEGRRRLRSKRKDLRYRYGLKGEDDAAPGVKRPIKLKWGE